MSNGVDSTRRKRIFLAQLVSLSLIWIFVIGIAIWIVNLILLSLELNDAPGASIGISIIAIPVFFTLASVLTYVFAGLQKEENQFLRDAPEK
jgi:hypothetical protein